MASKSFAERFPKRPNVEAIITHYGGVTNVQILLAQGGYIVSRKTVEKWRERKRIPFGRMYQLQEVTKRFLKQDLSFSRFETPAKAGDAQTTLSSDSAPEA